MADRARDPEMIERDIERTRDDLARSIDLLADRLSPKNAAQRSMARVKEEAGRVAADVGGMARREPDRPHSPITKPLLIGAGVVTAAIVVRVLMGRRHG